MVYTIRHFVTIIKRIFKIKKKIHYNKTNIVIPLSKELAETFYEFLEFFRQLIINIRNTENQICTLVIYTDVGPTGGGVKIFEKRQGKETLLQRLRCVFPSCSPLVSRNWYSTQMEQRVQIFALEDAENFEHKHLEIFTSNNSAEMLVNPQKRYSDYRYLNRIYKKLRNYVSLGVRWVPRDHPHIEDCDSIARSDLITPTEEFFHQFFSVTSTCPTFVQDHQNSFYTKWKFKPLDLIILPSEFSLSLKRKILYRISILEFPVFVVIPKITMLSQWFKYYTMFEIQIGPPFFVTQLATKGIVLCFLDPPSFNVQTMKF